MSGIMGEKQTSSDSGGFTADEFASFFVDKVEAVRQFTSSTPLHHVSETAAHTMASWEPVTPDDVVKLISNALNKSCQLDAAPTWLVKQYRVLLAPFISRLFNKSLATGCLADEARYRHSDNQEGQSGQYTIEELQTGVEPSTTS